MPFTKSCNKKFALKKASKKTTSKSYHFICPVPTDVKNTLLFDYTKKALLMFRHSKYMYHDLYVHQNELKKCLYFFNADHAIKNGVKERKISLIIITYTYLIITYQLNQSRVVIKLRYFAIIY